MSDILKASIKYFEGLEWKVCCSGKECGCMGMPIDPEYYVYQDILKADKEIQELKEKLDKAVEVIKVADKLIGEVFEWEVAKRMLKELENE